MMIVPPPPFDVPRGTMTKRKPHDPALTTVTLSLRTRLAMLAEALDLLAGADGANAAAAAAALRRELGKIVLPASSGSNLPGPTAGVQGWRRWRGWAAAIIQRTAAAGKSAQLAELVKKAAAAALAPIAADATLSGPLDAAAQLVSKARNLLRSVVRGRWKQSKTRLAQERERAAAAARGAGGGVRTAATTAAAAAGGAAGGGAVVATGKVADEATKSVGKALPWILGGLGLLLGAAAYMRSRSSAGGA